MGYNTLLNAKEKWTINKDLLKINDNGKEKDLEIFLRI